MDIFESLNHLNLLLQGRNTNRMSDYDAIRAFIAKLGLWQRQVQKGDTASFPNFDAALKEAGAETPTRKWRGSHLRTNVQGTLQF